MTLQQRTAAAFFVLMLAVQCILPVVQLPKERPAHFGWQMFSGFPPMPRYWIVRADGVEQAIDLRQHVGVQRLDADYHRFLPDYLLRAHPDAVAIRWQWPDTNTILEQRRAS
jgi:hypothetical protein